MALNRRYEFFKENNIELINIPFINLRKRVSDKYDTFIEGNTTFDKLAYKWYDREELSYIISIANPEFIDENDIESGTQIRIPFPIDEVESEIRQKTDQFKRI